LFIIILDSNEFDEIHFYMVIYNAKGLLTHGVTDICNNNLVTQSTTTRLLVRSTN